MTSPTKWTILIADDHAVVRSGLRMLLDRHEEFEVISEAANGREAVALANQHQPDVVVLDVNMPEVDGIQACRRISEQVPDCRVVMLTSYMDDDLLFDAIRAGAVGYVLKRAGTDQLITTLERLRNGEKILDPAEITQRFADIRARRIQREQSAFSALTAQELRVLALITEGMTNQQIATELDLAAGTSLTGRRPPPMRPGMACRTCCPPMTSTEVRTERIDDATYR